MNDFIELPAKAKDITGERFGRLVALGPVGESEEREMIWLCQCDCGNLCRKGKGALSSGGTRSCGCLMKEPNARKSMTHGMHRHPLYKRWIGINERCRNPDHHNYHRYGGRGITMWPEWSKSFLAFYDYISALEHCGEKGYTLDRIDNDKNYEPGNLRWATATQQSRNMHTNHFLTHDGKTLCLAEWAAETGINERTLSMRLRAGWDEEKTLTTPSRKKAKNRKKLNHE